MNGLPGPCPGCGYCPTCGRFQSTWPAWPYPTITSGPTGTMTSTYTSQPTDQITFTS